MRRIKIEYLLKTEDNVTINPQGEEYWEYEYDLLDRLISVKKENYDTTVYYVFGINDNVLYEQEDGEYSEYIYAGGQH